MVRISIVLVVIGLMTGCVYDPVKYKKLHDREFEEHMNVNGP